MLYDSFASLLQRPPGLDVIAEVANRISIPLTVAGGLRTLEDIRTVLRAGADKVAINTAAVHDPDLLRQASEVFGNQCIVASVEYYHQLNGRREVWTEYGREVHEIDALEWVKTVVQKGAGEIMITSIDRDGRGIGLDTEFIRTVSHLVPVPVIAGGGVGTIEHFADAAGAGVEAISAASIFHYALAKPFDSRYLQWTEKALRKGKPIDAGNVDFLNEGYGNFRKIPVEPCHLQDVKRALADAGFQTRMVKSEAA